jgi:hypothetical protein
VDRGALQAARRAGLGIGGWCPLGRRAEDGPIPPEYPLVELLAPDYSVRTEQNVIDSDGTLVLHQGDVVGGTKLTVQLAAKHRKPCLQVNLLDEPELASIRSWLAAHQIATLNCAGPRESSCPGIEARSRAFLERLFTEERRVDRAED